MSPTTKALDAEVTATTAPTPALAPGKTTLARRRGRFGWMFLAPFAVIFVLFLVVPLLYAAWLSLHSRTISGTQAFAGFENYVRVFNDGQFLEGVGRVLYFGVIQVPIMLVIALVLALMLDAVTTKLAKFSRLIAFMPYAVPAVIGALMWGFLYNSRIGVAGIWTDITGQAAPDFLGRDLVLYSLMNIVTWQMVGYNMIIMYAVLQGVSREIYEAARIDGANWWSLATKIKIPLMAPGIVLTLIFSIIGTLQLFTEAVILQSTRPDAIPSNFTPNMYAYLQAFAYGQFNYAAALSFVLGLVTVVGSYVFLFITRKRSGLND